MTFINYWKSNIFLIIITKTTIELFNFNAFFLVGENNFIDNCQTNEISDGLWNYQKQDFNEIQESNSDNDNFVMIKHIRLVDN